MDDSGSGHELTSFIWYHADAALKPLLMAWLHEMNTKSGFKGQLYVRNTSGKTTFMEVYGGIDASAMQRIEQLADESGYFEAIDRRCEAFEKVSP